MIITLSPAKLMSFETMGQTEHTKPKFLSQADELIGLLQTMDAEDIAELMSINPKLAVVAYQQIHAFNIHRVSQKQAACAYNGIVFQGLDFKSLSADDVDYAQDHLVILSGLYGALRPLDMIKPYRLEMQAALANNKGASLYDFWGELLTAYLSERLKKDDKIWLNLMSHEYTKVIKLKQLPKGVQIISPVFKQQTANGYKQIVVYTKRARGLMARFALKNRVSGIEDIKAFDEERYSYSEQLSKGSEWVFVR